MRLALVEEGGQAFLAFRGHAQARDQGGVVAEVRVVAGDFVEADAVLALLED